MLKAKNRVNSSSNNLVDNIRKLFLPQSLERTFIKKFEIDFMVDYLSKLSRLLFLLYIVSLSPFTYYGFAEESSAMEKDIETLLFDINVAKRRRAALNLGYYHHEKSLIALLEALHDEDFHVRKNAVRSLGRLRDSRAVPYLLEHIDDSRIELRNQVIRSLGMIRDKRAVRVLLKTLKDKKRMIRISSIWALTQIRDKRALPGIIEALFDKDNEVRGSAADSLGQLGNKKAIKFLLHVYHRDSDLKVRQRAALALIELGKKVEIPIENKKKKK